MQTLCKSTFKTLLPPAELHCIRFGERYPDSDLLYAIPTVGQTKLAQIIALDVRAWGRSL